MLHAIFRRAQRHFGLTSNPVAGLDRQPVRPSGDFRVLSLEEGEALARAARAGAHRSPPSAPLSDEIQAAYRVQDAQDAAIDQGLRELDALSRRDHFTADDDLGFVSPAGAHLEDSALRRRFCAALKQDLTDKSAA